MTDEAANSAEESRHPFSQVSGQFDRGIESLRTFIYRIGALADEHGRDAAEAFTDTMRAFLGPLDRSGDHPELADEEEADSEMRDRIEALVADRDEFQRFMGTIRDLRKRAPVQGRLLRNSALITAMSTFEALVSDIIHYYYTRYPDALPSQERILSLGELRTFDSIEDAENFVVSKEVDSVLRESLEDQLAYLTDRPGLSLDLLDPVLPRLIELGQRRNLLVHNMGEVNRRYLAKVDFSALGGSPPERGATLAADGEYLQDALDILAFAGAILIQDGWRKWEKDDIEGADTHLVHATYEGNLEGRHRLVVRIAEAAAEIGSVKGETKLIVLVNRAVAHRSLGEEEKVAKLIEETDWSGGLRFDLAIAVLTESPTVDDLLRRCVAAEHLTRQDLIEWPLFKPLRARDDFNDLVDRLFQEGSGT